MKARQLGNSFLTICLILTACSKQSKPCDDKLVVLSGDGVVEVISQWDACVARGISRIANNDKRDSQLIAIALDLCSSHAGRYATALHLQNTRLSQQEIESVVDAYRSNLTMLAASKLKRARQLGCEAQ